MKRADKIIVIFKKKLCQGKFLYFEDFSLKIIATKRPSGVYFENSTFHFIHNKLFDRLMQIVIDFTLSY